MDLKGTESDIKNADTISLNEGQNPKKAFPAILLISFSWFSFYIVVLS